MNEITYADALTLDTPVFIDVRAPVEFNEDHVPGAINIPLFNDAERADIGTIYRNSGKYEAVAKGSSYAGARVDSIVTEIRGLAEHGSIIVNCFRGGMRSEALVSLLNSLDLPAYKLAGGYKSYRKHVVDFFRDLVISPPVFVLHGLTGTGKTQILNNMRESIDLEGMAGHRSSVFGGIGLENKTQKMFESLLFQRICILRNAEYIVIEGESRKIGDLHIPQAVYAAIMGSPGILIQAPMERRVRLLVDEYMEGADRAGIVPIVESLESRIGRKNVAMLLEFYREDKLEEFAQFLLEKYYDPLYHHTLKKRDYFAVIENLDSVIAAGEVESAVKTLLKKTTEPFSKA